jgi:murein DD-endopeptidase MepM/ murein hydrolase activator NlpD
VRRARALCLVAFLLGASGCVTRAPAPTRPFTLGRGDSLWRVARQGGVSLDDLVRANPRMDPARLRPGSVIRVPVASSGVAERQADHFIWPVDGPISSRFGRRGRGRHEGLDLRAAAGTPVQAAEFGVVVSSGRIGNYGNVIIIRHPGRFVTVYAHNEENLVPVGAWVKRGQIIARVGQTGNATGPHLHFEVRRNKRPRDPLYYLPVGPPSPAFEPLARTQ